MVTRRLLAAVLLLVATVTWTAGCSGSSTTKPTATPTPLYSVVTPSSLPASGPIPAPTGPVVLTIEGADHPNVGDKLQFDMETLEKLGTVGYTAYDRQAVGKDVAFTGPLLKTVLDAAGVHGALLHFGAINDYTVDIPVSDAAQYAPMIATRADGERMDVANYGPLRVVYPTTGVTLDPTVYDARWIWQLTNIIAR